ncbi:MAG: HDIG domain-containing protein [Pirellulales bacterium]|nr:HDIG domain-containing protein [Pirellulales bacterium]
MSLSGQIRTRSERVAALGLSPGQWERAWSGLRRRDVLVRVGIAFLAAVAVCVLIRGWDPPFGYQLGYVPQDNITARVEFTKENKEGTEQAKIRAKDRTPNVFRLDPQPLNQLRSSLRTALLQLTGATALDNCDPQLWQDFSPPPSAEPSAEAAAPPATPAVTPEQQFLQFRDAFAGPEKMKQFDEKMNVVFRPYEEDGMLEKIPPEMTEGNKDRIEVVSGKKHTRTKIVRIDDVLIGTAANLQEGLRRHFPLPVAKRLFAWIQPRLRSTLIWDKERSNAAFKEAEERVKPDMFTYAVGNPLAEGGQPLGEDQLQLLRLEYSALMKHRHAREVPQMIVRGTAVTGLAFAGFLLCGVYMRVRQKGPLVGLVRLTVLLVLVAATVALSLVAAERLHAEILPLLLFGMVMAIVYSRELALLLSGLVALIISLGLGLGLREFLLLMGVVTIVILNLGSIRTRTKLIYLGLSAGAVAVLLSIGLTLVEDQPLGWPLLRTAILVGVWTLTAGAFMTALLPFIERAFGVLTDVRLLEYGDVSHPLLQELVRRAPSTYNHSLTVGSIAEAAAESIGARGLLCRVGAYFHDIGKMLKPGYFVENQKPDENRHESLLPAMSTLVIVAHIKDGYDLARQHHLPQPIIDMIAQHHGTTLVKYFYDRAQQQSDPNNGAVDESSFRYPGPKPQTKEAAVLMLADAVESASRTLVDPTPARIESLVRELAERRLDDGQFDESGLTLRELRTIERSLAMSLASIYHGRIKYPDQKTASPGTKGENKEKTAGSLALASDEIRTIKE